MSVRVRFNKDPMSALTHFVGLLFAVGGLVYLLLASLGDSTKLVSMAIYGGSLVLLFGASSAYHFFDLGDRRNRWLQRVDHAAIYGFIAGSYVPALTHLLDGAWRISMLAVVGGLAVLGTLFKMWWMDCPVWLSTGLYLALGWVALVPGPLIFPQLSLGAFGWLLAGGLAYTVGAVVFAKEWPDPFPERFGHHEVWHLFVLAGAGAHFFFVAGLLDAPTPPF
ncbi:MAG: hemolysin III family protein [Proteobacteria bacterium]|nr:hemolysin III family protein [Pseudomonadota bacterium]